MQIFFIVPEILIVVHVLYFLRWAAESLGLPLVQPYLGIKNITSNSTSIQEGLNFAVVGATALDVAFFEERGINIPTNYSLRVQLDWFKEILPSLCNTSSSKFPIFFLCFLFFIF